MKAARERETSKTKEKGSFHKRPRKVSFLFHPFVFVPSILRCSKLPLAKHSIPKAKKDIDLMNFQTAAFLWLLLNSNTRPAGDHHPFPSMLMSVHAPKGSR